MIYAFATISMNHLVRQ